VSVWYDLAKFLNAHINHVGINSQSRESLKHKHCKLDTDNLINKKNDFVSSQCTYNIPVYLNSNYSICTQGRSQPDGPGRGNFKILGSGRGNFKQITIFPP
jgi:hypothetical protein